MTDAEREELEDLRATFDLMWAADRRAVERWRAAHPGNELVAPDHVSLVTWLLTRVESAEQDLAAVVRALDGDLREGDCSTACRVFALRKKVKP